MSKPVTLAVVGCGTLATHVVLPHTTHADFAGRGQVLAVCDVVAERAEQTARRFGIPAWYSDLDTMLARCDAEAVLVVTPGSVHAEHALAAIRAGRHVYVQKPMAKSLAAAQEVVDAAKQAGVVLVAAPGQVLWPLFRAMRDVIRSGALGAAYMATPPLLGWPGKSVRFDNHPGHFFAVDGGPFHDHGGYGVQTLVALFGSVKRVTAMAANVTPSRLWNGNVPFDCPGMDNVVAVLDFGSGTIGVVHDAWCARSPGSSLLRVQCLEGTLETTPDSANDLFVLPYTCVMTAGGETRRLDVDLAGVPFCVNGHIGLGHVHVYGDILHLVTCIRRQCPPVASGERGLHFVEVIDATFRAARTGQAQEIKSTVPDDVAVVW